MEQKKKGIRLIYLILGLVIVLIIGFTIFKIMNRNNLDTESDNKINKQAEENNSTSNTIADFDIKDITSKKGEEIDVKIDLKNDSPFVAANFEYKYDSDSLEYVSYEVGDSLKNAAMTMVNNDEKNSKVLIGFVAKPEGEKEVKTGNIINLKFRIKEDITKDKINNEFTCTTLKDEGGHDIKYNVNQGIIKVK